MEIVLTFVFSLENEDELTPMFLLIFDTGGGGIIDKLFELELLVISLILFKNPGLCSMAFLNLLTKLYLLPLFNLFEYDFA